MWILSKLTPSSVAIATLVTLLWGGAALSGESIERIIEASPDGVVRIHNLDGSVSVAGWDKHKVAIEAKLGYGSSVDISSDDHVIDIDVNPFGDMDQMIDMDFKEKKGKVKVKVKHKLKRKKSWHWHEDAEPTALIIHVPASSRLEIETVSASVDVKSVAGTIRVSTVDSDVSLKSCNDIEGESIEGDFALTAINGRMRVCTVSGSVTFTDCKGDIAVCTVSGDISVIGGSFGRGSLESVAGSMRFEGAFSGRGRFEFENVEGSVVLRLPDDVAGDFEVETFSGSIDNNFGVAVEKGEYTSEKHSEFELGQDGPRVSIHTFNGDVSIEKR